MQRTDPARTADVQAWHACLDVSDEALETFAASLSDDERSRAARFVFGRDRRRFIAARGILRRVLGSRLGVEAGRLRFAYGERGKPFLPGEQARDQVSFSVAHSQGHGLFAVASRMDLGADIEVIRPLPGAAAIAERFFSPVELALLLALPPSQRQVGFYLCWTRKEACVKALGAGLAHPLDAFSVDLTPGEPARLLEGSTTGVWADWSLHDLSCLPIYAAAIAVRTGSAGVRVRMGELGPDGAHRLMPPST